MFSEGGESGSGSLLNGWIQSLSARIQHPGERKTVQDTNSDHLLSLDLVTALLLVLKYYFILFS